MVLGGLLKRMRPRTAYSEEQMADAFEKRLGSRRPLRGVGRFSQVFREVDCHRGRPDFIGIVSRMASYPTMHGSPHNIGTACVLSLLKSRSPRSLSTLTRLSHLTRDIVLRSVRHLVASGLVEELSPDRFILSGGAAIFDIESTAFELKLKSPRRATFQAQQYTLFAQRVWIVVPPSLVSGFDIYRPVLGRWGIGLATFNPHSHAFRVVLAAKRGLPVSREHQAYAMLRLVGRAVA